MKKWQEERNYRCVKDANGNVTAGYITVDGVEYEVTPEVFAAYSTMDRRERYVTDEQSRGKNLSLDQLQTDMIHRSNLVDAFPSAEAIVLEMEEDRVWESMKQRLKDAIPLLPEEDRELIQALFYDGTSARAYAAAKGFTHRAALKRRDRILRDLKKVLEKMNG